MSIVRRIRLEGESFKQPSRWCRPGHSPQGRIQEFLIQNFSSDHRRVPKINYIFEYPWNLV